MNKESFLISFRFRYKFQQSFSVRKLPSTNSDVSLFIFFYCSLNKAYLQEERD